MAPFLTYDHTGLQISKRYPSYSFHLISAKLYEDIGYHGVIQAANFLDTQSTFTTFMVWKSMEF